MEPLDRYTKQEFSSFIEKRIQNYILSNERKKNHLTCVVDTMAIYIVLQGNSKVETGKNFYKELKPRIRVFPNNEELVKIIKDATSKRSVHLFDHNTHTWTDYEEEMMEVLPFNSLQQLKNDIYDRKNLEKKLKEEQKNKSCLIS